MTSENKAEGAQNSATNGVAVFLVIALVYILSFGPVARGYPNFKSDYARPFINWFYAPVIKLMNSPVGGPLAVYVFWWEHF
jgi:hypothetical protein